MRDRKTWLANKQATVEDNGNDTKYDASGFFVKKQNLFLWILTTGDTTDTFTKGVGKDGVSSMDLFSLARIELQFQYPPPTPTTASPTWKMCMYFLMISHATQKEQASSPHCAPASEARI